MNAKERDGKRQREEGAIEDAGKFLLHLIFSKVSEKNEGVEDHLFYGIFFFSRNKAPGRSNTVKETEFNRHYDFSVYYVG